MAGERSMGGKKKRRDLRNTLNHKDFKKIEIISGQWKKKYFVRYDDR